MNSQKTQPWLIVATREIYVRITNRTFVISTLVTTLLIAGLAAFSVWQGNKESTSTIVVTDQAAEQLVTGANKVVEAFDDKTTIKVDRVDNAAAARTAVEEGDAIAWLHSGKDGWTLTAQEEVDLEVTTAIEESVRASVMQANAAASGATISDLMKGTELATDRFDGKEDNSGLVKVATIAFAVVFMMAAMLFGLQIASSVVEEKQSRLVEIIATAIPLRHLLAGKILGNATLALGQIILYGATGLIALSFTDIASVLPGLTASVGWFFAFFAFGFLALACLYAIAGAMASRNEDLQSTTAPMTYALMGIYFLSFGISGSAQVVVSYVPIASVIAMPGRILGGDVAWWEPIVSLGITAAFAGIVVLIGERAYRHSLMQSGGKLSWRKALVPTA